MENTIKISHQAVQKSMWLGDLAKRLFDISISLLVLIIMSPFYILVAIAVKRDSPGPVFYRGQRIGRKGKYFQILKFRTMYETPESYNGPKVTAQDDLRVTPLGHWLRNTKLNEFPQFWNVLKGEMSLVGPRPEDPSLAKTWPRKTAQEILSVRPGITSPASVLYRNEEEMLFAKDVLQKYLHEITPDKMRLDQLYVRYRSFSLDLDIIFWTALLLIPKIKAYSPPEKLLYVGPFTRFFQRYMSWFFWDSLLAFVSISFSGILLRLFGPLNFGLLQSLQMAVGFALLYSIIGWGVGVNRINWFKATPWNAIRLFTGWFASTGIVLGIHSYLGYTQLTQIVLILTAAVLSLCGFLMIRYRSRLIIGLLSRIVHSQINSQFARERVLIVGSGRTAEHIAWLLDHQAYSRSYQIVGFIDDDFLSQGLKVYGSKVIGTTTDMQKIIKKYDVGLIILADYRLTESDFCEIHDIIAKTSAKVFVAPDIFGSLNGLRNSSPSENPVSLDDFKCQNCIVRYSCRDDTSVHSILGLQDMMPVS